MEMARRQGIFSVFDVVKGILAAARCSGVEGEVFNIGSGKATSVNLLAKEVLSLAGVDLEIQHEKPRSGDIKDSYADIAKAKRLLGFEPKVTLHEGLKAII
jgi:nucleoside-diphosphate-sugar epimerase